MNTKEKDSKTFNDKLKQFFRINKGKVKKLKTKINNNNISNCYKLINYDVDDDNDFN